MLSGRITHEKGNHLPPQSYAEQRAYLAHEQRLHDAVYIVTAVHEVAAVGVIYVLPDWLSYLKGCW